MTADSSCNVAGCDHTRPDECEVVRCATCNEPYDGTEASAAHIARAHLDILARDRRAARVRTQAEQAGDDHSFLDRFKRRATLIGGPMDGRVVPIPLPDSMPVPESTCMGGPGPLPRVWHHYERAADDWYRYAGPCAGIDHHGGAPHDHCDHQWDDATERGHRCELVHGHAGDHACGCCNAEETA